MFEDRSQFQALGLSTVRQRDWKPHVAIIGTSCAANLRPFRERRKLGAKLIGPLKDAVVVSLAQGLNQGREAWRRSFGSVVSLQAFEFRGTAVMDAGGSNLGAAGSAGKTGLAASRRRDLFMSLVRAL